RFPFRQTSVVLLPSLGEHLLLQGRVRADGADAFDHEAFDLPGRDGGRRTSLATRFGGAGTNVITIALGSAPRCVGGRHGPAARQAAEQSLEEGAELVADRRPARRAVLA